MGTGYQPYPLLLAGELLCGLIGRVPRQAITGAGWWTAWRSEAITKNLSRERPGGNGFPRMREM